ncbi:uncharacterized protein LOC110901081 [Helianthus annuus]|uniref:uncharacterized protein LOC110901081 n=1 Tax=Helianthus annuus TaxID=4232 RepID=UPI000B9067BF|nr:uncharacterized protein LOC110901081 [Helianthus annuus]
MAHVCESILRPTRQQTCILHEKKKQDSARKDIERTFGVLKKRWGIIAQPTSIWDKDKFKNVMYAYIILHNMILEDSGKTIWQYYDPDDMELPESTLYPEQRLAIFMKLRRRETHDPLHADLTSHLWVNRLKEDNEDEDTE